MDTNKLMSVGQVAAMIEPDPAKREITKRSIRAICERAVKGRSYKLHSSEVVKVGDRWLIDSAAAEKAWGKRVEG